MGDRIPSKLLCGAYLWRFKLGYFCWAIFSLNLTVAKSNDRSNRLVNHVADPVWA